MPGMLPVLEPRRRRARDPLRPRGRRHHRAGQHLRAQELLLPRPAEGLPDQPVRPAAVLRRRGRHRSRGEQRTKRVAPDARAPRGRRGQAAARGLRRRDAASSTSTAPARRCSRSSPSRTCAPPPRRSRYAKTLHSLVHCLGVSDGNMQEGTFRCDANVSVRPAGQSRSARATEIKNLNSFRFLEKAIEFEVAPPDRADRGRRQGRPGDAALRSRPARDARDAQRRKTRTTTATSPTRTCCRSRSRRSGSPR